MGQPVRKTIQEVYSNLIKEDPFRTLLIDGNSLLFMCFKDTKVNTDGVLIGPLFQFLLQIRMILTKGDFKYVYVTFDDEYSGVLRYNLYKPYKGNRDKNYADYGVSEYMKQYNENLRRMQNYIFNKNKKNGESVSTVKEYKSEYDKLVDENFDRIRDILCQMFNELYIRWYIDEVTEGDDLIAYYCLHKKENEKIIIVSGDMDLTQLLADDISIYNLHEKKFITPNNFKETFGYYYENVLVKKIFLGDTSDNISNISLLSETKLYEIMPEFLTKKVTVDQVKERVKGLIDERVKNKKKPLKLHTNIIEGVANKEYDGDFYEINKKIIDLKHPLMSDEAIEEIDNMMYTPQDPTDRSYQNLYKLIVDNKIEDLMGDTNFASFFSPFKKIEENEKKLYNDSINS